MEDIRWKQRFENYRKALLQLEKAVEISKERDLTDLEEMGMIQAFEFTYELAWNTIKDFFESQGDVDIKGSKDAFRLAFKRNLITDGEVWMSMVKSRQDTVHGYNEDVADDISEKIINLYFPKFSMLLQALYVYYNK